jgi:hypothetical protein
MYLQFEGDESTSVTQKHLQFETEIGIFDK